MLISLLGGHLMHTMVSPVEYDLAVQVQRGLVAQEHWVEVLCGILTRTFEGLQDGPAHKDSLLLADFKRLQAMFRVRQALSIHCLTSKALESRTHQRWLSRPISRCVSCITLIAQALHCFA